MTTDSGHPGSYPDFEKAAPPTVAAASPPPGAYPYPPAPPWAGSGQPYPMPVAPPQSVGVLGLAIRVLLGVTVLVDVLRIWRIGEQRSLLRSLQQDPGSVTLQQANAADHAVAALVIVSLALLLATAVVWIVWLWRMRTNADSWGGHLQRRSKGWVIGSWFCPVVNLWFPYMIMRDVWDETERAPGDLSYIRPRRALLLTWWLFWVVSKVSVYATRGDRDTLDDLITRTNLEIGGTTLDIVAAVLAILVVTQLTRAQTARMTGTTSSAG